MRTGFWESWQLDLNFETKGNMSQTDSIFVSRQVITINPDIYLFPFGTLLVMFSCYYYFLFI